MAFTCIALYQVQTTSKRFTLNSVIHTHIHGDDGNHEADRCEVAVQSKTSPRGRGEMIITTEKNGAVRASNPPGTAKTPTYLAIGKKLP